MVRQSSTAGSMWWNRAHPFVAAERQISRGQGKTILQKHLPSDQHQTLDAHLPVDASKHHSLKELIHWVWQSPQDQVTSQWVHSYAGDPSLKGRLHVQIVANATIWNYSIRPFSLLGIGVALNIYVKTGSHVVQAGTEHNLQLLVLLLLLSECCDYRCAPPHTMQC